MKNYIYLFLFLVTTQLFYGQNSFDKFVSKEDVTAVVVNKKMFDLMSSVKVDVSDTKNQRYMALIKKLDNLKVFTTKNAKTALELKATAEAYVKTAGLKDYLKTNQEGKNVRVYVKSGASAEELKELVMCIETIKDNETIVMLLLGDFQMKEVSVLTDKMKIPGGTEINKSIQ